MADPLVALISHPLVMLALGNLGSFLAAASQASRERGRVVGPVEFVRTRPYRIAMGIVGSLAGFVMLTAAGEATAGAAFGVGYAGTDILQRLADAAERRATGPTP